MFRTKNTREAQLTNTLEPHSPRPHNRPGLIAWLAFGVAATLLTGHNDSSSVVRIAKPTNKNYLGPAAEPPFIPTAHQKIIAPCDQPYQGLGNQPNASFLPDVDSDNPLLACLGSLTPACYDVSAPNGVVLCLDFAAGSAYEEDGQPHITVPITANGNEFYDYTLYTPFDECELAVAALNTYAREALTPLSATGNIAQSEDQIEVSGWTTGCLTPERSAEIMLVNPS